MVQTRSRSNPKAAVPPETTAAASASNKSAPSKRKNAPTTVAAPATKATKAEGTADVAEAKAVSSEANSAAKATNGDEAEESSTASSSSSSTSVAPPAPAAPATATIPAPVEVPTVPAGVSVVASEEDPSVHHAKEKHASGGIHPYEVVVSDIEGTTTPIVFVKENLFPYVISKLPEFLKRNWASDEMKSAIEALRVQAAKDVAEGHTDATPIATESGEITAEKVQEDVIASIGWQMKADRKIGALKAFQGYMWREGYANGDLKGALYEDVIPAFDQWKAEGKRLYIYSSGSVPAQKLLFGYSEKGDLLHYFSGHYDTTIGQKVEADSYTKIAADIGLSPSKILFLSDNILEIIAAKKAGLQAVVTDRPGNAPLSEEDHANNIVVKSFLEIPKPQ
ncbi:enolase-phosphatase E1 [Entomortierella parvispora]|uniref:Enolase-phosphatase E1 n=1 Tax=Entomortierella parvispora TaxID=205924 RepID=A0A9P3H510_9FUNG|nr:enolase-phosphatase E1 [Entomortierella parvispora]